MIDWYACTIPNISCYYATLQTEAIPKIYLRSRVHCTSSSNAVRILDKLCCYVETSSAIVMATSESSDPDVESWHTGALERASINTSFSPHFHPFNYSYCLLSKLSIKLLYVAFYSDLIKFIYFICRAS